MNKPTFEITLEQSKAIVKINEWISGMDAEYIEKPLLKATVLAGKVKEMKHVDDVTLDVSPENAVHESNHREVECWVASVKVGENEITDKKEIVKTIIEEMPNEDYQQVLNAIAQSKEKAKKK